MAELLNQEKLYSALRDAFGNALQRPIPVALGYEDSNGTRRIEVPAAESDTVGKVYFHELPGYPTFSGEAYNPGAIPANLLKYGLPVRINRDLVTNEWTIIGQDTILAPEYLHNVPVQQAEPVTLTQFTPGLLDESVPSPSMFARVISAPYRLDNVFKYIPTQATIDFTSQRPATNGKAKYALVEVDFSTTGLVYTYGSEFNSNLNHQDAFDAGFCPAPSEGRFMAGYIKLLYGQTTIRRTIHIWAVQEVISRGGGGGSNQLYYAGW